MKRPYTVVIRHPIGGFVTYYSMDYVKNRSASAWWIGFMMGIVLMGVPAIIYNIWDNLP